MRFMCIVKASPESERGEMPSEQLLREMGEFNQRLVDAGVMLDGDGLKPSSEGARVNFKGKERSVTLGPFAETAELIAGYWVIDVPSLEDAIEWMKQCPNPMESESHIEIRPFFEPDDFGEEFTPELREAEEQMREQMKSRS
ncbi:MAG: YciI family protein [Chloroflexota bacterium]|jgi:hypothetical protein|nr:YciI family protein [Chloroflexota bacterium]